MKSELESNDRANMIANEESEGMPHFITSLQIARAGLIERPIRS